ERLRKDESFLSRHLHLRKGKLFLSGSRRSALNAGISEEEFRAFKEAVRKLNEMKAEGYVTFEREKGQVMLETTEKLSSKIESAQEGPSIMASTPTDPGGGSSDGVTKLDANVHSWGTSFEVYLNSTDASVIKNKLNQGEDVSPYLGALFAYKGAWKLEIVLLLFGMYSVPISNGIEDHNNGTGVVVSFNVVGWYGGVGLPPSLPIPDV
ncbi:MAG: hypothetical protein ACLFUR_02095, partial [Candidatus Hadarchaeia archaeon]